MKVLTFSGFKGSGKDEAANHLSNMYFYKRVAFADVLKDMVHEQHNISMELLNDPYYKEQPLLNLPVNTTDDFVKTIHKLLEKEFASYEDKLFWTPRALLVLEGSIKRSINSNYWTDKIIEKINSKKSKLEFFVISDLRYKNEYLELKEEFGKDLISIKINRFDTVNTKDPSEHDLNNHLFDYVIDNKGTIEEFYKKLDNLMENINKT